MANSYDRVELYENSYSCDASAARLQLKSARWRTVPLMEVPSRYWVIAPEGTDDVFRSVTLCVCTHTSLYHAGTGVLHIRRRTTTSTSLIEIFTSPTRILVVKIFCRDLHACRNMHLCRYLDACSDMHPVVKSQWLKLDKSIIYLCVILSFGIFAISLATAISQTL